MDEYSASISQRLFIQANRSKSTLCVRWNREYIREFRLAVVLFAIVYAGHKAGFNVAPAMLPLAVWAWAKQRPLWQARLGVLVLCGGSDVMAYMYFGLLMLQVVLAKISGDFSLKIKKDALPILLFIGLVLASSLINQLEEINLLALPLWAMSFLSPLSAFFYFREWPLSRANLHRFIIFLISVGILQCVASYIDYINVVGFRSIWALSATPDEVKGTFKSASDFGWFLLEVFAWCYAIISMHKLINRNTIIALITSAIVLLFVYTADAKTMLGSFFIGIVVVMFLFYRWQLRDRTTKIILFFMLAVMILGPMAVQFVMERFELVYIGYLVGEKSSKVQFIERAIDPSNRSIAHWLIGYGPGTCGSRSANARAYDILYKDQSSEANKIKGLLPPYSSKCTRRFLADLYDWRYAETASGRSALLGNPFNSWTAIWFELGVVGVLLWGYIFLKILKSSRTMYRISSGLHRQIAIMTAINVVAVSVAGLITQQIESPVSMFFLWFFAAHVAICHRYKIS